MLNLTYALQVFGVLEHRNKQAMYELGETLNKLTVQSNKDQAATSDLSKKMQRDSRSMRALTSAALVYMPASLLAVSTYYSVLLS